MAEQERKTARRDKVDEQPTTTAKTTTAEKAEKLKKSLDEVLDEIDTVLESNAEEFVKSYVQRGGQ
jgi:ubiquitin-like protein Pup